jgi:ABC-2 type transport system permease protein
MRREGSSGDRRAATVIAVTTAKRAARSGTVWGVLFGGLAAYDALGYHTSFPTLASRQMLAQTFGDNTGLAAVIGPAWQLNTAGGWVAWRTFGLLVIVGAMWGLLTATRLMRREEDSGRWELLLAGQTTRRRATVQAIAGPSPGWLPDGSCCGR